MSSATSMPYQWTLLWPGLSRLWLRGSAWGLLVAVGFAWFVNLLLATTFIWPAMLGGGFSRGLMNGLGWLGVLCFWGVSLVTTWKLLPRWLPGADARGDDHLLAQAQALYLKGFWYDAEERLRELLEGSPRDADARLLLAAVLRRQRRPAEAQQELETLEQLEGGGKWLFEIDQERRLLAQSEEQAEDDSGKANAAPDRSIAPAPAAAMNQQ